MRPGSAQLSQSGAFKPRRGATDVLNAAAMTSGPYKTVVTRLRTAWQERAIALKAVSFGLIGVVNTLIDLGVFLVAYGVRNCRWCRRTSSPGLSLSRSPM